MQAVNTFKQENPGVKPLPPVQQARLGSMAFGRQLIPQSSTVAPYSSASGQLCPPLLPMLLGIYKKRSRLNQSDNGQKQQLSFNISSLQAPPVAARKEVNTGETIPVIGNPISSRTYVPCF